MGRPTGYKPSVETRERASKALRGRPKTDEHKASIANARLLAVYGEKPSPNAVGCFLRGQTMNLDRFNKLTRNQMAWIIWWEYPV